MEKTHRKVFSRFEMPSLSLILRCRGLPTADDKSRLERLQELIEDRWYLEAEADLSSPPSTFQEYKEEFDRIDNEIEQLMKPHVPQVPKSTELQEASTNAADNLRV